MSASTVIGDVTATLQELLIEQQQLEDTFLVTLISPAQETIEVDIPKINMYLYQIMENPDARNTQAPPNSPHAA